MEKLPCAAPLAVALLALGTAGCSTSEPLPVVCPESAGDPVGACEIAGAPLVIDATVEAWASSSRVLDLEGYPDTVFTPVALHVDRVLKGAAVGRQDVLLVGCVGADGASIQGALETSSGKSSGLFFISSAGGYNVVVPQGFFRKEAGLLKNPGFAAEGLVESELVQKMLCADAGL
ncbi:MAG: hypothetical protein HY901_32125 [Deltaproteobacteria bacterium]|nr:hypothetical protein [Deltaproteobacteria bacterium]